MRHTERGRIIRGHELIGMTIWGPHRERLGTIKDFVIDYEGDCPALFFAMAPEISGWSGDYVIVPFHAFDIRFDERQRHDYFLLGVTVESLRRAPHLAVDRWNTFHDRHFFSEARQFYQRVERTAARPESGADHDVDRHAPRDERARPRSDRDRDHLPPSTREPSAGRENPGQPETRKPSVPPSGRPENTPPRTQTPAGKEQSREPAARQPSGQRGESPTPPNRSPSKDNSGADRERGRDRQAPPSPDSRDRSDNSSSGSQPGKPEPASGR